MGKIAAAVASFVLMVAAGAAHAACTVPYTFVNNTQIADANQVNANFQAVAACAGGGGGSNIVTSLATLSTLPASTGPTIVATATAPQVLYTASATPCQFNDGGSQVPTSDGGCWVITTQSAYDIRWWGQTAPIQMYVSTAGNDFGTAGAGANFCVNAGLPCATLKQASYQANRFWAGNSSIVVNVTAGTFSAVNVYQNGPLLGAGNITPSPTGPNPTQFGPGMIAFVGAGSSTVIRGGTPCSTFQGSNGGLIAVQNMEIISTVSACGISLAAQQGGQAYDFGGITWGGATFAQIWAQDVGSLLITMGSDSLIAGGNTFWACSGASQLEALSSSFVWTVAVSPGLTFTSGFMNFANGCDATVTGVAPRFTGSPISSRALSMANGARVQNQVTTGGVVIPFNQVLPTGNAPFFMKNFASIFPAIPSAVQTACPDANCGTGATTTVVGSSRSGAFTITAGAGGGTGNGAVVSNNVEELVQDSGALAVCSAFPLTGAGFTAAWGAGSTFSASLSLSGAQVFLTVDFSEAINGAPSALTPGGVYGIGYSCPTS